MQLVGCDHVAGRWKSVQKKKEEEEEDGVTLLSCQECARTPTGARCRHQECVLTTGNLSRQTEKIQFDLFRMFIW